MSHFILRTLSIYIFIAAGVAQSFASRNETKSNDSQLFPADLLQISSTDAFSKYVFVVDKSLRKLMIYERSGEEIIKIEEYPADIGKNGGNKQKRDDAKTPEGIYFFQKKLSPPEIPFEQYGEGAFTTDYPNLFDQRQNKTGSGIWLHSIPDSIPLTRGSRGCVVVRNEVIKKLGDYIKLKETPILIFDQVQYITKEEHVKRRNEIRSFIDEWKKSWESQNIEAYMEHYDSSFSSLGYNFEGWKKYKDNLKNKYSFIKVSLDQPYILMNKNEIIIKTFQKYESDKHTDFGIKTLYTIKDGQKFKIIKEDWLRVNKDVLTSSSSIKTNPI